MRRAAALLLCAPLWVAGCDVANDAADMLAREQAKGVVNGVVTEQFPGVNAAPVTDCIIDAASAGEILTIAGASVQGVTEETVRQVLEIGSRPDAVTCIAENSLGLIAG